jgi:hypothetical protein
MKGKSVFIFLIVIFSMLSVSAASADFSGCAPQISLVSQDPVIATPGSYVKLVFEVSGLDYCSNGVAVKLNPSYPFSLDSGIDSMRVLNAKPYVSGYKGTWNIGYTVRIAEDASGENYTIQMLYHSGTGTDFTTSSVSQDFDINIINSLTSFDAVVQEAGSSTVSIAIANTGKNAANSVIVKIPQQENFKASGTNGQMVGNLASGDYTIVSFTINSERNFMQMRNATENKTTLNPDELKVEIDYTDNIGVRRATYLNLEMISSLSNNSTLISREGFQGYKNSTWSVWYTIFIILGVVLIVFFILYKKFPDKSKQILGKIFKKKKHELHKEDEIPEWVKKEKEKKK